MKVLEQKFLHVAALSVALVGACTASAPAADIDDDGIDDTVEQSLIDYFRPYYYYDAQENDWPASLLWVASHCQLHFQGQIVYSQPALAGNPELLLQGDVVTGVSSSLVAQPSDSLYRTWLPDDLLDGQGPIPVGTYARVTPVSGQVIYSTQDGGSIELDLDQGDRLLQYWQYFPFSDSQFGVPFCDDGGDHCCDWTYLEMYLSAGAPSAGIVRYIVYHHHGDQSCTVSVVSPGDPLFPADGVPRCYLEEGAHEWWPGPTWAVDHSCGFFVQVEDHDGLGPSYRTSNVKNVGELWAPMPDLEAKLFVWFNGRWGKWGAECPGHSSTPAASPGFQFWPTAYAINPPEDWPTVPHHVSYVQPSAPAWTSNGRGSRHHPHQSLAAAVGQVESGGVIRAAVGEPLATPVTISKPLAIEAFQP